MRHSHDPLPARMTVRKNKNLTVSILGATNYGCITRWTELQSCAGTAEAVPILQKIVAATPDGAVSRRRYFLCGGEIGIVGVSFSHLYADHIQYFLPTNTLVEKRITSLRANYHSPERFSRRVSAHLFRGCTPRRIAGTRALLI